tara:strand:+ start:24345 stop:24614 length:270 start_codon:yes stop_codon:yes gene_type:complete
MRAAQQVEYQITRQLLQRREGGAVQPGAVQPGAVQPGAVPDAVKRADLNPWADRLIAILAVTTGLVILGNYLEELLWAAVVATTVVTLR